MPFVGLEKIMIHSRTAHWFVLISIVSLCGCGFHDASHRVKGVESQEKAKIKLVGWASPPQPFAAILVDSRCQPAKTYFLRQGDSTNGITVLRVEREYGVTLSVDGCKVRLR